MAGIEYYTDYQQDTPKKQQARNSANTQVMTFKLQ